MVSRIGRDGNKCKEMSARADGGPAVWHTGIMNRSTHPTEILLGFMAGFIIAFVVQQPLVWLLHHAGLTARHAFSTQPTSPMSVQAMWSRAFWDGVFGIVLAWFGLQFDLSARWLAGTIAFTTGVRTLGDWFIVPMVWGHVWTVLTADAFLTPLILNVVWAAATAVLLVAMTLAVGTWGTESLA